MRLKLTIRRPALGKKSIPVAAAELLRSKQDRDRRKSKKTNG
jgi:hypothetical protein